MDEFETQGQSDVEQSTVSEAPEAPEKSEPKEEVKHTSLRSALRSAFKEGSVKEAGKVAPQGLHAAPKEDAPPKAAAVANQPASQPQAQASEPILAPADMRPEERQHWDKLPPDLQRYISRRSYDVRNLLAQKGQELANTQRRYAEIDEVLSSVRDEYARQGVKETDIIKNAIAWDKYFKQDPVSAAREYLQRYNVDPTELLEGAQPQQQRQQSGDPQYQALQDEIAALKREREMEKQQIAVHNLQSSVEEFINSKPLFKDPGTAHELESAMAPIVAGLKTQNPSRPVRELLDEAYNYVTRGNPRFAELLTKLDARAVAEKTKVEAQKAQQASRSISGGPGSGSPKKQAASIREALRLAINDNL